MENKHGILIHNHDFISLREYFIFEVEYNERMSLKDYFNLKIKDFEKELKLDYFDFLNCYPDTLDIKFDFENDDTIINIKNFKYEDIECCWKVRLIWID